MPREIEEMLSAHDDVAQVFAIGLTDERWGEIGCAVVVRRAGATITEDDVIALCKANLARFKVPKQVIFLEQDELPTTPTGKVQKYRLVPLAEQRLSGPGLRGARQ
jgi:fatty-acyl-CoA synthase